MEKCCRVGQTTIWHMHNACWMLKTTNTLVERVIPSVKREKPLRCNQSDVYYHTSISTCIELHYAHHQENKAVYYCVWCSALVVLAEVGCGCVDLHHKQCALCAVVHGLVLLMMGIMMPETC